MLIVDVRTDDHFDGRLIPGTIRLPWSTFRYNDTAANEGSLFVGVARAQEILGRHGPPASSSGFVCTLKGLWSSIGPG
jgi:thiosulfate/3-mercaptopyruvate sulfurtransferase